MQESNRLIRQGRLEDHMTHSAKVLLLWLARACGLFWCARQLTCRGIMIVAWHGVSLGDEHVWFPKLFSSSETLQRRLDYIVRHFTVTTLEDAIAQLNADDVKPGQVVVTFDDGYYNFLEVAAPLLLARGVRATVYVVSGNMYQAQPYHPLVLRYALLATKCTHPALTDPCFQCESSFRLPQDRGRILMLARAKLEELSWDGDERNEFCSRFCADLDLDFQELLFSRRWSSVTCADARTLVKMGFSVQLHSHKHQHVTETRETFADDLETCRRLIEDATGTSALDYCYPAGLWDKQAWNVLAAAGIRSAVTTQIGPNFARTPSFALRRVLDYEAQTQLEFECHMSNFRWLIHVVFHPWELYQPSESRSQIAG